jgi:hypothetical protein
MKGFILFLSLLLVGMGCKQKEMSLEKLKNASWTKLDKGIDYISTEKNDGSNTDSLRYTLLGWIENKVVQTPEGMDSANQLPTVFFHERIKGKLADSKHGYLRINIAEAMKRDTIFASIYLKDNFDSTQLRRELDRIQTMYAVQSVEYISKAQAAQLVSGVVDTAWNKYMTENPLPASIMVGFDAKKLTADDFEKFKSQVVPMIPYLAEIELQGNPFAKNEDSFVIVEYKR